MLVSILATSLLKFISTIGLTGLSYQNFTATRMKFD